MRRTVGSLLGACLLTACSSGPTAGTASPSAQASHAASAPACRAGGRPPLRFGAAIAYDAARKTIVLFSGIRGDGSAPLADTWTWDGCQWASHNLSTTPPGRSFGAMAYDPGHSNVVLFGGGSANSDNARNDTWIWDGQGWSERHPTSAPPLMSGADLAYDKTAGAIVLVGQSLRGESTVTWTWDGRAWASKQPAHAPGPRADPALAPGANSLLYFGGTSPFGDRLSDLWSWNGSDWSQVQLKPGPAGGPARMARDDARASVVLLEEDGTWTLKGLDWTHQQPQTVPPYEAFRALAYDAATQKVIGFGGQSSPSQRGTDETWAWDGASWTAR